MSSSGSFIYWLFILYITFIGIKVKLIQELMCLITVKFDTGILKVTFDTNIRKVRFDDGQI